MRVMQLSKILSTEDEIIDQFIHKAMNNFPKTAMIAPIFYSYRAFMKNKSKRKNAEMQLALQNLLYLCIRI